MFMNNGQPEMIFSRGALIRSPRGQRPPGMPRLTRVHFAAGEAAHRIRYEEGDLLLFNDRRILHGRDGFLDGVDGGGGQRHMVRLWLGDEEMAGKPPDMGLRMLWGDIFGGEEGGSEEGWPVVPDPS